MAAEIVNVHAAKTHLSRLLERAEAGEEIVIGRAGRPVARLIPYVATPPTRIFGSMRGEIQMLDGFDDLDDEIIRDFEDSIARPFEP